MMDRAETFFIKCQDNNISCPRKFLIVPDEQEQLQDGQIRKKHADLLRTFARRSIGELKHDSALNSRGFLLFGEIKNIREDDFLFELKEYTEKGETYSSHSLQIITHNIMGVFTLTDCHARIRMQITSRFDPFDGSQPFLSWLLKRVCAINQTHYLPAESGDFWNFLLKILFMAKLADAGKVGLYRQYVRHEYNDLKFKGHPDIDRHIRLNYPLKDKIAYSKREICFDNPINHLLRYAIALCEKDAGYEIASPEAIRMAMSIKAETPTWKRDCLNRVLADKDVLHEIRHPFYAEFYEDLRVLSLMLIENTGIELYADREYSENTRKINGVIFDGAWLWEAFLAKLLPPEWVHSNPETGAHKIFAMRRKDGKLVRDLYPDFRLPVNGHPQLSAVILDAKYKRGDASEGLSVRRQDMYQCLGYMLLTGATAGGVIYPPLSAGEFSDRDDIGDNHVNCPDERIWHCHTFEYPGDLTPGNFNQTMLEQEAKFRNFVRDLEKQAANLSRGNTSGPMSQSANQ